jgi:diaminopimelate epimerase
MAESQLRLEFTKMHGLGNDFVVIDMITQRLRLTTDQIRALADRHFGVGFDQLLMVEAPTDPEVDFGYRIFNADGSEVSQCGNGARCFARFVRERRLTQKTHLRVQTASGIIELKIDSNDWVTVNMGQPRFSPEMIPFIAEQDVLDYTVNLKDGSAVTLSVANMGNPHAVLRVDNVDTAAVEKIGAELERHERFPERVNVGFLQVVSSQQARLRVFERGSGETLACGTGACAAAVTGIRHGWLQSPVTITLPGGDLEITWAGEGHAVFMRGPTAKVFDGYIRLPEFRNEQQKDMDLTV